MATIVSVSFPAELRAKLDGEARRQRRSRSFVVAEAVRGYLAEKQRQAFATASRQTLREGLALTASERVQLAEQLWQELAAGRGPGKPWTAGFETFAAYDRWRRDGGKPVA